MIFPRFRLVVASIAVSSVLGLLPGGWNEDRTPKNKCKNIKATKSSKGARKMRRLSSTSSEDDSCYCPCCNEDSCLAMMLLVENDPTANDGTGTFCQVGGPTTCVDRRLEVMSTSDDVCFYDANGDLDDSGAYNLGDCCNRLQVQHTAGCDCPVRRNRQLNEISSSNERKVTAHGNGVSIEVKADHSTGLDWIHSHVAEMQAKMENGEVAREWDPLFKAYFDNSHHIEMACDHKEDANSLTCKYSSESQCGVDLIRAHAGYHTEIAASLRDGGSHEILTEHAKPESCE